MGAQKKQCPSAWGGIRVKKSYSFSPFFLLQGCTLGKTFRGGKL